MSDPVEEAIELLPCPFCGSKAVTDKFKAAGVHQTLVRCTGCNLQIQNADYKASAIERWNTRSKQPAPVGVEKLKREASELKTVYLTDNAHHAEVLADRERLIDHLASRGLLRAQTAGDFVMVPREPTEEMQKKFLTLKPYIELVVSSFEFKKRYQAMLSAAPGPDAPDRSGAMEDLKIYECEYGCGLHWTARHYKRLANQWRGIAAEMGFEPKSHKDVRPKGWLLERCAMFKERLKSAALSPAEEIEGLDEILRHFSFQEGWLKKADPDQPVSIEGVAGDFVKLFEVVRRYRKQRGQSCE